MADGFYRWIFEGMENGDREFSFPKSTSYTPEETVDGMQEKNVVNFDCLSIVLDIGRAGWQWAMPHFTLPIG